MRLLSVCNSNIYLVLRIVMTDENVLLHLDIKRDINIRRSRQLRWPRESVSGMAPLASGQHSWQQREGGRGSLRIHRLRPTSWHRHPPLRVHPV